MLPEFSVHYGYIPQFSFLFTRLFYLGDVAMGDIVRFYGKMNRLSDYLDIYIYKGRNSSLKLKM